MNKWNELLMAERVPYLKVGIDSGIYNTAIIAERYNKFVEGGDMSENISKDSTVLSQVSYKSNNNFLDKVINANPWSYITDYIISEDNEDTNKYEVLSRDTNSYFLNQISKIDYKEKSKKKYIESVKKMDKSQIKLLQKDLANAGYYDIDLSNYSRTSIKNIQSKLIKNGYLSDAKRQDGSYIELDGIAGSKTQDAFNRYNRDKNIDGIVGRKTTIGLLASKFGDSKWNTNVSTYNIDGCAEWVTKKYENAVGNISKQAGVTLNAWQMPKNIIQHGGTEIYNIYNSPEFNNIKSVNELKNKTENAIKNNPIDYSKLSVGDIVGIYMPSSNMHTVALKEGTTKNTHVGIITGFDDDGMPIVEHNIHSSHRKDRADSLTGSLFGKAIITVASRPKYNGTLVSEYPFESSPSRFKISDEFNNQHISKFADGMEGASEVIQKIFPTITDEDMDTLLKIGIAVQKRETNFMNNRESDVNEKDILSKIKNEYIKPVARYILGRNDETKSSNMAKYKLSTLNANERKFLGINSTEDLEDEYKAGIASLFTLSKNFDYFKRLQSTYPNLGITDDDIDNLTILSYNQGMNKLYHIGFDNKTGKSAPEELYSIRDMSEEKLKPIDVTSTNWRYLGKLGKRIVKGKRAIPYIGAARSAFKYISRKESKR